MLFSWLMGFVRELNLCKLDNRLLIQDWHGTNKLVDERGNFKFNHGINHMDINDGNKFEGMNLARCHTKPRQIAPGLDDDENMEEILLRLQIIMTKIMHYITN